MLYRTSSIQIQDLPRMSRLEIKNQEEITKKFGEPLSLKELWELIESGSQGFKVDIEYLREADEALYDFLYGKGFFGNAPKIESTAKEEYKTPILNKKFSLTAITKLLMPLHQQQAVMSYGEEREAIAADVDKMLKQVPGAIRYEGNSEELEYAIVYAHYFYAQTDWYILQKENKEILFGYVVLNGDTQNSEYGDISIEEITSNKKIELDFHWTPKPLYKVLAKKYPEDFPDFVEIMEVEKRRAANSKPSNKSIIEAKIKGFETALKYASGDSAKTLQLKINGFKTALKYAS